MGSCISKCRPSRRKNSNKNEEEEEQDQGNGSVVEVPVQDKLVIITSEDPPLKSCLPPHHPSLSTTQNPSFLSPLSASHSSSSPSSFSFSTTGHNSSSSSSSSSNPCLSSPSSSASSISTSKHKPSFSKEYLQPCLKGNPQLVLLDPTKPGGAYVGAAPSSLLHHHQNNHQNRVQPQLGSKWNRSSTPSKPNSQAAGPTKKRQRASSPLTRKKSFRRDSLRSSSSSRRFSSVDGNGAEWSRAGTLAGAKQERNCKRIMGNSSLHGRYGKSNINVVSNSAGGYVKKENLKGLSDPNNRSRRLYRSPSMRKQTELCSLTRVVSGVDEINIGEEKGLSSQDVEMFPVEDLDNPLIALDCFIFL